MRGDDGVRAAGDQCGHVEGGPHWRAAAGDCLSVSQGAAVAIDGSNANEACDLAPIEAPKLRQFGDEGAQSGFAHAGHAGEKVGVGLPGWALSDRPVDVAIEFRKLGLQDVDMPVDGFQHARLTGETTAVFLRHIISMTCRRRHQLSQRLGFGVRDGPGGRTNGVGEVGDCSGVETIGFGELAGRTGEIADLTRIDHRQGQVRRGERARNHGLVSPCRLERDQGGRKRAQALDETLKTLAVARDGEGLAAWPDADVQPILRHIDSNKHIRLPSLHMRARDAAPATVRDVRMDGWGAMLRNGLLNPRSVRAPIRRRDAHLTTAPQLGGDTRTAKVVMPWPMPTPSQSLRRAILARSPPSLHWSANPQRTRLRSTTLDDC